MKREWTIPILSDKIFLFSGKWWNCSGGHATTSWAATLGFEDNSNISYFASFSLFFTSYPLNRFFRTINTHGMSAFWGYCPMTHLFRLVPSCCLKTTMFKTYFSFYSFVCFLKVFICLCLSCMWPSWHWCILPESKDFKQFCVCFTSTNRTYLILSCAFCNFCEHENERNV